MTNQEASFILANIDRRVCDDELNEALDMAIKALEQSGDLISRQAVLDLFKTFWRCFASSADKEIFKKEIKALPPVKQEPKTGHWIKHDNGAWWECSECHAERAYGNKYCPDCGSHNGDIAKMVEPQERSDKE